MILLRHKVGHTVNFFSEMGQAKHVSGKNIFCSVNVYKSRGKRIFEIVHWPFELPPNQHRPTGPFGWHKWCSLARPSKGQCTISKILSSLIFSLFIEQNIFFPETCFACTISQPKFTVCAYLLNDRQYGQGMSFLSQICTKLVTAICYLPFLRKTCCNPLAMHKISRHIDTGLS